MQTLDVLEGLMHDLVAQLITHTRGQAVFHAAGVGRNGRVALLVADSGAGKSSLAGWLVSQGFNYLSDEILAWDAATGQVSGLTAAIGAQAWSNRRSGRAGSRRPVHWNRLHLLATAPSGWIRS